MSSEDQGQRWM